MNKTYVRTQNSPLFMKYNFETILKNLDSDLFNEHNCLTMYQISFPVCLVLEYTRP